MGLLFTDSFDHYSNNQLLDKWTRLQFASLTNSGRNGFGVECQAGFVEDGSVTKVFNNVQSQWTIGFAFYGQSTGAAIYTSSDGGASLQWLPDGRLALYAGSNLICQSTNTIPQLAWVYIEFSTSYTLSANNTNLISGSIAINSVTECTGGSQDSLLPAPVVSGTPTPGATTHSFSSCGLGTSFAIYDDMYMANDTTFRGDCKIVCYLATGNVSGADQWTGSYTDINSNPSTDSSYIMDSSNSNDYSLFIFQQITGFTGNIKGVSINFRLSDVGGGQFSDAYGNPNYNTHGISIFPSSTGFIFYNNAYDTDPIGGGSWSVATFNALTYGIQNFSGNNTVTLSCSQIVLEVMLQPTTANARVSQGVIEYPKVITTANARISQGVIEFTKQIDTANARITQGIIEWPSGSGGGGFYVRES